MKSILRVSNLKAILVIIALFCTANLAYAKWLPQKGDVRNVRYSLTDKDSNATDNNTTFSLSDDPSGIVPPTATITRTSVNPTNATSVTFRVSFNQEVVNVSTTSFTLTKTDAANGTIASITGYGGVIFDVTVNNVSGDGTLRLDIGADSGIENLDGDAATAYTSGPAYTIDNTIPTLITYNYRSNNNSPVAAIAGNTIDFTVNFNEALKTPTVTIAGHQIALTGGNGSKTWFGSYTLLSTDPDGLIGFTVAAEDLAGNQRSYSSADFNYYINYDNTRPSVNFTVNNPGITTRVTATFNENVFLGAAALNVTNGTVSNLTGSGSLYFFDVTATTNGPVTIEIPENFLLDDMGLRNIAGLLTYTPDFIVPSVSISSTAGASGASTGTSPMPFTATFSEAVTGFVAGDLTITNGTATNFSGSGTTYTFDITPTADGAVTVDIPANTAQDISGNNNTAATQFSLNYIQPVTAAPVLTSPVNGSFTNGNVLLAGTAPANSNVTLYLSQNGSAFQPTTPFPTDGNGNFSIGPITFPDASYSIYAVAQLSGYTVSIASGTNTFVVDTSKPTVTLTSTAGANGSTTSTTPIPFTATFSENVTGFASADITVSGGTIANFSGSGTTYTFDLVPSASGAVTLSISANVAQDAAGNGNDASTTFSITAQLQQAQTITFNPLNNSVYGASPITLTGVSDAGLTITYTSSDPDVASVIGNQVTIHKAGFTDITADQAGNSSFFAAAAVTQRLTVDKKEITVTADAQSKTYGANDPALTYTYSGTLAGQDEFTGTLTRDPGTSVADYAIRQGTLTLGDNYAITFNNNNLTIGKKELFIGATASAKQYDGTDSVTPALSDNRVAGDDITVTYTSANFTDVNAFVNRSFIVSGITISGPASGNYELNNNSAMGFANINPVNIVVTADALSKILGAQDPALTYTYTGTLVGQETFSGALSRDQGETLNTYNISQGTLTLTSNYNLTFNGAEFTILPVPVTPSVNNTIYVNKNVVGGNKSGDSWTNAIPELADALKFTRTNDVNSTATWSASSPLKIWVAGGTYLPLYSGSDNDFTINGDRKNAFVLTKNIQLTGGFAGTEQDLADRDLSLTSNRTILSGNIGNVNDASDNTFTVLVAATDLGATTVDGIVVQDANANGQNGNNFTAYGRTLPEYFGGLSIDQANISFSNLIVRNNYARIGSGIIDGESASTFVNTLITGNTSGNIAGLYMLYSGSTFINTTIAGNSGNLYAIENYAGNPTFHNSIIWGNGVTDIHNGVSIESSNNYIKGLTAFHGDETLTASDLFANPSAGDFTLKSGSPAINAGDNNNIPSGITKDLAGTQRTLNGTVDAGAFESNYSATVASVDVPADMTYGTTTPLVFTVNFTENVTVNTTAGTPALGIVVGSTPKSAVYTGGSGTKTLTFSYTPVNGDLDEDGITISSLVLYSSTITYLGDPANLALNSVGSTANVLVDAVAPTLSISAPSVASLGAGTANVTYTVTYDGQHNITLNAANITLNTTGTAAATINTVTISGNNATVELTNISGLGTIGISIADGTGSDNAGNLTLAAGPSATFNVTVPAADLALVITGTPMFVLPGSTVTVTYTLTNNGPDVITEPRLTGVIPVELKPNRFLDVVNFENIYNGSYTYTSGQSGSFEFTFNPLAPGASATTSFTVPQVSFVNSLTISAQASSSVPDPDNTNNSASLTFTSPSNDATLTAWISSAGAFSPTFTPAVRSYTQTVSYATTSLTVTPTAAANATMQISFNSDNYTEILSGSTSVPFTLIEGSNVITILVTAQNGTTKYYTLIVYRDPTPQNITFNQLSAKTYGDADFDAGATSDNTANPVTYSSDNLSVATIVDGKVHIVGAGSANITASQSASPGYAYATNVVQELVVNKRAITVTADAKTKAYGASDPALTYQITTGSLVSNGDLTGEPERAAGINADSYAITQGTIAATDNYELTFVGASFNITKLPLTITAYSDSKLYNGLPYNGGNDVYYTGFISGESELNALNGTLTYGGSSQGATNAGFYEIMPGGFTSDNYEISYVAGGYTIEKAPLTVTANNVDKVVDGVPFSGGNGVTYSGFVNGDDEALLTGVLTYSGNAQGAVTTGQYDILPGGLSAINYEMNYVSGLLSIYPPSTVVSVNSATANGLYGVGSTISIQVAFTNSVTVTGTPALTLNSGGTANYVSGNGTDILTFEYSIAAGELATALDQLSATALSLNDGTIKTMGVDADLTLQVPGAPNSLSANKNITVDGVAPQVTFANLTGSGENAQLAGVENTINLTFTTNEVVQTPTVVIDGYTVVPSSTDGKNWTASQMVLFGGAEGNATFSIVIKDLADNLGDMVNATTDNSFVVLDKTVPTVMITSTLTSPVSVTTIPVTLTFSEEVKPFTTNNITVSNGTLEELTGSGNVYTAVLTLLPGASTGTARVRIQSGEIRDLAGNINDRTEFSITYAISQPQTITFAALEDKTYGDQQFELTATSDSGLPVTYTSSDESIASIWGNIVTVHIAGSVTITASQAGNGVYNSASDVVQTLTINKRAITVTPDNLGSTYGDPENTISYVVSSGTLMPGDQFTGALGRDAGNNAGTYPVNIGTLSLGDNYALTVANGSYTIGQRFLRIVAYDQMKDYKTPDPAFTYYIELGTVVGNDMPTGSMVREPGENAGSYAITQGTFTFGDNYSLDFGNNVFQINKANITVTAGDVTKTYDGTPFHGNSSSISYAGFVGNEDASVFIGTLRFTGTAENATDAGTYEIIPYGLDAINYNIAYNNATLNINKAASVITADAMQTFTFDGQPKTVTASLNNNEQTLSFDPAQNFTAAGTYQVTAIAAESTNYLGSSKEITVAINSPVITGVTLADGNFTYDGAAKSIAVVGLPDGAVVTYTGNNQVNAGTYPVTATVTMPNYNNLVLTASYVISKADLTVTANAATKTYNGVAYTGGNGVAYSGFAGSDNAASLTGTLTYSGTSQGAVNANSYVITPGGLTSNNYNITFANGTLTIGKADLTVTANAATKTYNGVAYTGGNGVTYSGFAGSDNAASLTGTITYSGTSQGAVNVNSYVITPGGLTSGNYNITFANGTLTIGKAALTVTANAATKTYDKVAYTGGNGVAYSGFAGSDNAASLTGTITYSGTSQGAVNANSYVITPGGLTSNNYNITFANGTLTIGKAALTVTANAAAKTYDKVAYTGGNGVAYSGFAGSDNAASLAGTLAYSGTSQGAVNANSYVITPGGLTSDNYNITFANGTLTIGKAELTVTANAASKTYDKVAYIGGNGVTYSGFAGSDNAASLAGTLTYSGTSQGAVNANSYVITPGGLTSSNYNITFANGTLNIGKAELTVTADAKTKVEGEANPLLTISYSGFAGTENNSVLLTPVVISTNATSASVAGSYPITVTGATAANYNLIFVNGTLTITPGAPTNIVLTQSVLLENSPAGAPVGTVAAESLNPNATYTYTLVSGNGDTDNALFTITGNAIATTSSLNYEAKANYSIRVKVTNQHGSTFEKVLSVALTDVNEAPTLNTIANAVLCTTTTQQSITLSGISAGPEANQTTTITLSNNNAALFESLVVSNGVINYRIRPGASGNAVVIVTVKDNGGTANGGNDTFVQAFTITVNPLPVVAITSNVGLSISKGATGILTATGGTSYVWSNTAGIIGAQNTANLTVRPMVTTTYTVTATNANGCTSTQTIKIEVADDFKAVAATNIVSPNGDGVNDKFIVDNIDAYPNNVLMIFDIAGRTIYTKAKYDNSWEGTLNGVPLAEGTYYYVIDFGDGLLKKKGFITIVRQ